MPRGSRASPGDDYCQLLNCGKEQAKVCHDAEDDKKFLNVTKKVESPLFHLFIKVVEMNYSSAKIQLMSDVVAVSYALLGNVSENYRLVSFTRVDRNVYVRFILEHENPEDLESIDSVITELDTQLNYGESINNVRWEINYSDQPLVVPPQSKNHYMVYKRRE